MILEGEPIFIDTNILIYANYSDALFKDQARNILKKLDQHNLWISRQVIREFLVYATRYNFEIQKTPVKKFLELIFENFKQYKLAEENASTTEKLKELIEIHNLSGKKIHDANIVATMLSNNLNKILTHNVQDFERFNKLIKIIPLID